MPRKAPESDALFGDSAADRMRKQKMRDPVVVAAAAASLAPVGRRTASAGSHATVAFSAPETGEAVILPAAEFELIKASAM